MRILSTSYFLNVAFITSMFFVHTASLAGQQNQVRNFVAMARQLEEGFDAIAEVFGVTREDARELAVKIATMPLKAAKSIAQSREIQHHAEVAILTNMINDPNASVEVKEQAQRDLLACNTAYFKSLNKTDDLKVQALKTMVHFADHSLDTIANEQKATQERRTAVATEIARWQTIIKESMRPRTPLFALGLSGAIFAGKKGSELLVDELYAYWAAPELAQETSLLSPTAKFYNFFWQIKPEPSKISDVILEPKTQELVSTIAAAVKNIAKRHENFQNVLLYGPAGTGKTMLAKRMARESGLEYIYFAASDIDQFGLAEALQLINRLFVYARNSSKKLMIIIDECEILFGSRSNARMSEQTRKVLTKFLALTGTKNPDFMIVGLTNRIQDFDEASLSRFDERIKIDVPAENERRLLIAKYLHDYIITARAIRPVYPSIVARIFGKKPSKPRRVAIATDLLDEQKRTLHSDIMDKLTHKLVDFPGREIEAFANKLRQAAMASKDGILTQEILDAVTERSVESFKIASCSAALTA